MAYWNLATPARSHITRRQCLVPLMIHSNWTIQCSQWHFEQETISKLFYSVLFYCVQILPCMMTDASVDDFWGGVDGGVSHVEGLVFTRLTGVLWKHPSTHFLKLLTGESSGSPVVTHWTARNAWNWTTGLAVLFGELSVLKLCVFLGCSATSIVFDGVFSSFSSFSRVSVQQTKDKWEFFLTTQKNHSI